MMSRVGMVQVVLLGALGDDAQHPQGEHSDCAVQQRDVQTLAIKTTAVPQAKSVARVLQITECFFDLHTRSIQLNDLLRGVSYDGQ